ncbi:ATP-binding protein [Pseudanabaena sp. FACHB-1998]|uniref:ATP-binding protein n=1 Tax=Pseudanabaena sp. FACHB-1998 TaxID=2692858 RepID=UPI00168142EF|nr:ATP-binding protein [Pseudanabaena sp. FACHB-1998]MBD2175990.1 ATP-binding protein [Pseudanabaena sp. FACHB-1998]
MSYQLTLKNRFEDLEVLSNWIGDLSKLLGISHRGTFRLQLATEEAVTNIIQNAYENMGEHDIFVDLLKEENTVTVSLRDRGFFFDPLAYPEAQLPNSLEAAQEGGLGIHLIRNYADEFLYERIDNENILTLAIKDLDAVA